MKHHARIQKVFQRGPNSDKFVFCLFCFFEGSEAPKTTKAGNYRPTSEMPLKWRFAGMATLNAGFVACVFQEIQTSNTRKPYIFVIFRGGGGIRTPCPPPSGSAHEHIERDFCSDARLVCL